jgi:hypothetical protein
MGQHMILLSLPLDPFLDVLAALLRQRRITWADALALCILWGM